MSSSPPIDAPRRHPARWRSPRGWPLRTRLAAIMIVLLAVLGFAVGTTAELVVRKALYDRVNTQLEEATRRAGPCAPASSPP